MKRFVFLLSIMILLGLVSCDETSNPSSSFLIEKTVSSSSEVQIFQSADNFKIVFPENSISGNLEFKVKKESSVPELNIQNLKKGKNFYKIKFNDDGNILKPIQIIINYDKSAIPTGKTAPESVFGYIYSSGSWKLADYELDEQNSKIIISLSSTNGKVSKEEPILLEDGEIIIGDAYTTTDSGQGDEFLVKMQKSKAIKIEFAGFHSGLSDTELSYIKIPLYFNVASEEFTDNLTWNGNQFSATLDNGGWISGTYNTKTKTISLEAYADQTKSWSEAAGYDTVNIVSTIKIENVPYDYDWMNMFYKFTQYDEDIKPLVKQVTYIKTTRNSSGTKVEEYKSTDYKKNVWLDILFMHY